MYAPTASAQPLLSSPVAAVFPELAWNPLVATKCGLNEFEKTALRSNNNDLISKEYIHVLLKLLGQASSSPSCRVCKLTSPSNEKEALGLFYVDSVGVITHYAIYKLLEFSRNENKSRALFEDVTATQLQPLVFVLDWDGDLYAQQGAALCLAHLLPATIQSNNNNHDASTAIVLQQTLSWIAMQCMSSNTIELAMPALWIFMDDSFARRVFGECGGIGCLAAALQQQSNTQILYEATYCLWRLSLDLLSSTIQTRFARDGAIPALVEMVVSAPREKVVRVALAALVELATCSMLFITIMLECDLLLTLNHYVKEQHYWKDVDMVNDLKTLHKLLHQHDKETSNDWDIYVAQVESGQLEWGSIHTSKFIQQHIKQFEQDEFALVKKLIQIIVVTTNNDDDTIAIACFDLGEFVRHYPNGRSIVKTLGGKKAVMQHLNHDDPEVQRHALQATSKILIKNWEGIR